MARRVIDDVVMTSDKYTSLREMEVFKERGLEKPTLMVSDKVPKTSLKKSTVTTDISIISPVVDTFNKITIDANEECKIVTPKGNIGLSASRMRFLKAVLVCSSSSSKVFANVCISFSQHIISEVMSHSKPSAIISSGEDEITNLIFKELSDFYVSNCT